MWARRRINILSYHTFVYLDSTGEGYQAEDTGVIVPQLVRKWPTHEYARDKAKPPIDFQRADGDLGVNLWEALTRSASMLPSAEAVNTGDKFKLRLEWPGLECVGIPVDLRAGGTSELYPQDPTNVLARKIAERIVKFLEVEESPKIVIPDEYRGWERYRFELRDVYLLRLVNVAPLLWQPVLSVVPRYPSKV